MLYYLYKITNKVNHKIYIGVHESSDINDNYFGSGKQIKSAIKKYGKENFIKEILEYFSCKEEMYKKESLIVNEEFVSRSDTYNMSVGGFGASISKNRKPFTGKHTEKTLEKMKRSATGKYHSEESKRKMSENSWSKRDPISQHEHAVKAGKMAKKNPNPTKISESLREYFSKNGSPCKGVPKPKITCPHCQKEVAINTANRWHFDNCTMVSVA